MLVSVKVFNIIVSGKLKYDNVVLCLADYTKLHHQVMTSYSVVSTVETFVDVFSSF